LIQEVTEKKLKKYSHIKVSWYVDFYKKCEKSFLSLFKLRKLKKYFAKRMKKKAFLNLKKNYF